MRITASDGTHPEEYAQAVLNADSPFYIGKLTEESKLIKMTAGAPTDNNIKEPLVYSLSDLFTGISLTLLISLGMLARIVEYLYFP